jgi:peptidyl-prolyl cis-trans isomerase B (cyclophilin B)
MSNENYNMPIKRWEMAYIIDNAIGNVFGVRAPNDSRFTDDEQINSTYDALIQGAISSVAGFGIVRGDENGNFNASAGGTRAEAVTIINRTTIIVDELISYTTQAQKEQEAYEKAIAEKLITYTDIPTGNPVVKFTMENGKSFKIKLYPEYAPQTCANFIKLVKDKFYDGLTFHRIVDGFVAQGGDPEGTGAGGSENLIFGEFYANGFENNNLSHTKGIVSMARSSHPNSASSQFFICYGDASALDGQYAAFGEVIEGMDVVESFMDVETTTSESGEKSFPKTPIVIKKAEVVVAK